VTCGEQLLVDELGLYSVAETRFLFVGEHPITGRVI
jgi:hypothetical protein